MKLLSFLLTLSICSNLTGVPLGNPAGAPWRVAANGGINVLYCYLQTHDVRCEYADLLKDQATRPDQQSHSALSLARMSTRHGLPLQAVSLTMEELASCPLPVIVHMDGESPETGAFLMVFE